MHYHMATILTHSGCDVRIDKRACRTAFGISMRLRNMKENYLRNLLLFKDLLHITISAKSRQTEAMNALLKNIFNLLTS